MIWSEILQKSERSQRSARQVLQEELQKTVLTSLSREGLFQKIVFQGGTALRLFYANPRSSEDLDFALQKNVPRVDLSRYSSPIETFTSDTFPFLDEISLETQKETPSLQRLILKTHTDLLSRIPRLHLELANVPSYLNQPRVLEFAPYNPAIQVEEKREILADKLAALACRPYVKGRDIWDIHYLTVEGDLQLPWDLVGKKIRDYRVKKTALTENLRGTIQKLRSGGREVLSAELKRFLPKPQYDQYRDHFPDILEHVIGILESSDLFKRGAGDFHED